VEPGKVGNNIHRFERQPALSPKETRFRQFLQVFQAFRMVFSTSYFPVPKARIANKLIPDLSLFTFPLAGIPAMIPHFFILSEANSVKAFLNHTKPDHSENYTMN
jgi:hypothetical protein